MLKGNLIAIAIIILALVFTSNTFGQQHRDFKIHGKKPVVRRQGVKSPYDAATGQFSITSPRDQSTGQATSRVQNPSFAPKNPAGIITEIGMPVAARKVKTQGTNHDKSWEGPEFDASVNRIRANQPNNYAGDIHQPLTVNDRRANRRTNRYIGETEKNLIDTSTGEVVWADEIRSRTNPKTARGNRVRN